MGGCGPVTEGLRPGVEVPEVWGNAPPHHIPVLHCGVGPCSFSHQQKPLSCPWCKTCGGWAIRPGRGCTPAGLGRGHSPRSWRCWMGWWHLGQRQPLCLGQSRQITCQDPCPAGCECLWRKRGETVRSSATGLSPRATGAGGRGGWGAQGILAPHLCLPAVPDRALTQLCPPQALGLSRAGSMRSPVKHEP